MNREQLVTLALAIGCTFAVVWPVASTAGVPLFAHDWNWSPYAARALWTRQFLLSSWIDVGLGEPNSAVSLNPLAWLKVGLPAILSGRGAQIVYLSGSLVVAALGTYRVTRRNLDVPARSAWIAIPLLLATPFVFNKIASGQSSYWAGFAAFVWGLSLALDAFRRDDRRLALASGACFALASVQLQFLAFAWVFYVVAAAFERRPRALAIAAIGMTASATLAFPSIWFLALRGTLAGAQISPPYGSWLAALSASPADAAAMLGYIAPYAEWALGENALALAATHLAAYAAIASAVAGVLAARGKNAWTLATIGFLGWWWLTGVHGFFGAQRETLFENISVAGFMREFYHGGALYAVALVALAVLGISRLAGRARALQIPIAVVIVAGLGAQTWSGGLGRVLAFTTAPRTTDDLAAAAGGEESRVLFLPAQQPLRTKGDAIGGNDGLDWIDAAHSSLYEYYLPPPIATVAAALATGDAATARRILGRVDASAVVYRAFLTSGDVPSREHERVRDRSFATLRVAFGAPRETSAGTFVFRVPHAPMLDGSDRLVAQPANIGAMRDDRRLTYVDTPGDDAATYAVDLDRATPDPRAGWISRRDVAAVAAARVASAYYGVLTLGSSAPVTFRHLPAGNLIAWDRARGMHREPIRTRDLRVRVAGPAAITEVGEMPYPTTAFAHAPTFVARSHDAPWAYGAVVRVRGRTALVLRERYDAHWRLDAPPGLTVERHLRADGFANAWIVSGDGEFPVRFTYAYQTTTNVLLGTSFACFFATVAGAFAWGRA